MLGGEVSTCGTRHSLVLSHVWEGPGPKTTEGLVSETGHLTGRPACAAHTPLLCQAAQEQVPTEAGHQARQLQRLWVSWIWVLGWGGAIGSCLQEKRMFSFPKMTLSAVLSRSPCPTRTRIHISPDLAPADPRSLRRSPVEVQTGGCILHGAWGLPSWGSCSRAISHSLDLIMASHHPYTPPGEPNQAVDLGRGHCLRPGVEEPWFQFGIREGLVLAGTVLVASLVILLCKGGVRGGKMGAFPFLFPLSLLLLLPSASCSQAH